ncbi:MAG: carboxypeptidase regulatory-like domain-containing protein [Candidatus Eisenbacteria bacterium]
MSNSRASVSLVAVLAALLLILSCSQDGGNTQPGPVEVSMVGSVEFPAGEAVDLESVVISFGDHQASADPTGWFTIQGNEGLPGLALACSGGDVPMLMAIVPDPQEAGGIQMDVRSTSLALTYLNPLVCVAEQSGAQEVLSVLDGLREIDALESLLASKMTENPEVLGIEDAEIDSLLTEAVTAYLNSYPAAVARYYPESAQMVGDMVGTPGADVSITPGYPVSGHEITYSGADKFMVTNARGRWAYCVTPSEEFLLFPNGTLLDALKGKMWAPSEREFNLDLEPNGDTLQVFVYGAGWASDSDNNFDDLTNLEKPYVLYAGGATVLFEFVPQIVSVIANTSSTFGRGELAKQTVLELLGFLRYPRRADYIYERIRAREPFGLVWFIAKETLGEIVNNEAFRAKAMAALRINLGKEALASLGRYALLPAKVVLISDNVTTVMKTTYGFYSTRFKTSFAIWEQVTEIHVGKIAGSVHDKGSGLPIDGATVDLEGDTGNPMNPAHQVHTGASGGYYFENIMVGEKTIRASKTGYIAQSVTVNVIEDTTVTAPYLELEVVSGSVGGNVVDEILQRNSVADIKFKKRLDLTVRQIGGEHTNDTYIINNGSYSLRLAPGTYRLVASHEDYYPDSIQVTVEQDHSISAPRDLLMKPKGRMEGTVQLDMNADGTYETELSFTAATIGARKLSPGWPCPSGPGPGQVIDIAGITSGIAFDGIEIIIDTRLGGTGQFDLGAMDVIGCSGYTRYAAAAYVTTRYLCNYHNTDYNPMSFTIQGRPEFAPCNCGITDFGDLFLEEYGKELTQAIEGGITADLAGSKICECYCCRDTDGDGQEDDWVTSCAKARLNINFRVLVGSLYEGVGASSAERVLESTGPMDD